MESKSKVLGHAVHPILVVFPLGLFATSIVFDLVRLAGGGEGFATAAFYMIGAGILGGLAAAVFGLVDFLAIPGGTRAKTIGAFHGLVNLIVVGLFIASWGIRYGDHSAAIGSAILLAGLGVALALVSGWLGGELVERHGVSVDDGAHLDAPSSLSGKRADDKWSPPRPLTPHRA
jgi:uncharacterized membrane protein